MEQDHLDMDTITVAFEDETLDRIDDIAFVHHREHREAAIRTLLDCWLKERDG